MAEYIEREALEKALTMAAVNGKDKDRRTWAKAICVLHDMPTADVAPVVHGMWLPSESDFDDDDAVFEVEDWCDWQCSACYDDICYDDPMSADFLPKFCPNCGAKMDKKEATYD